MPNSTQVADGQDTLAAQYNNLRLDVLNETTGHPHDGTSSGGKKVDHKDLSESDHMTGRLYQHSDIDTHIDANAGVHDLDPSVNVAGSAPNQYVIVAGTLDSPAHSAEGTCYFSENGLAPGFVFTTIISLVISNDGTAAQTTWGNFNSWYTTINAAGGYFKYHILDLDEEVTKLSFIAVGTK